MMLLAYRDRARAVCIMSAGMIGAGRSHTATPTSALRILEKQIKWFTVKKHSFGMAAQRLAAYINCLRCLASESLLIGTRDISWLMISRQPLLGRAPQPYCNLEWTDESRRTFSSPACSFEIMRPLVQCSGGSASLAGVSDGSGVHA